MGKIKTYAYIVGCVFGASVMGALLYGKGAWKLIVELRKEDMALVYVNLVDDLMCARHNHSTGMATDHDLAVAGIAVQLYEQVFK